MRARLGWATVLAAVLAILYTANAALLGQAPTTKPATAASKAPVAPAPARAKYVAPRTADGRPDLAGVWSYGTATPLERPNGQDKPEFTDETIGRIRRLRSTEAPLWDAQATTEAQDTARMSDAHTVTARAFRPRSRGATGFVSWHRGQRAHLRRVDSVAPRSRAGIESGTVVHVGAEFGRQRRRPRGTGRRDLRGQAEMTEDLFDHDGLLDEGHQAQTSPAARARQHVVPIGTGFILHLP